MTPPRKKSQQLLTAPALLPERIQADRDLTKEVRSFLQGTGWQPGPSGPVGALWHRPGAPQELAVPWEIRLDSREYVGIVERLSAWLEEPTSRLAVRIQNQFIDVTRLRAANDIVIGGTIPLAAGRAMVTSAEAMLRAAGTTSHKLRSNINGNFSRVGDELVARARMGHTEVGSYVVPLLMPLSLPLDDEDVPAGFEGMDRHAVLEPAERRVTRTLAQALVALNTQVVQPARRVHRNALHPFVDAGGSRELVVALSNILAQPAVAEFEASFTWAGGIPGSSNLPSDVDFPSQSIELLAQTASLMREMKVSPTSVLTGPIVLVRHEPGDPFGEVGIQTVRSGRPCEVQIRVRSADIDRAHVWAIEKRILLVEGAVRSQRGRPLLVEEPTRFMPLEQTMLGSTDVDDPL